MKNKIPFNFKNSVENDEHILVISGAIGEGGWFYDATSASDVRNALDGVTTPTVRIKLNSGGGDAFDGIEIYNYLKDHPSKIIVEVTSLAASAASILAMGADEIVMRTGSNLMIHEASTVAYGTKNDIQKTMNALETIDDSIVSIYEQRTGLNRNELKEMIENETWLTAEQALEKGFVDRIEQESSASSVEDNAKLVQEISNLKTQVSNLQTRLNQPKEVPVEQPKVAAKRVGYFF